MGIFVHYMAKKITKKKVDPYLKTLGNRITELMNAKGITQLEMAYKLNTFNTQVRRIQRGEVNSTINMLRKIADILDVSIEQLVKES